MASQHKRNVGPMQAAARCGAKTRSGTPCEAPMIKGGKRCRMHGGKGSGAPRGNRNAFKTGVHTAMMKARNRDVRDNARRAKILIAEIEITARLARSAALKNVSDTSMSGDSTPVASLSPALAAQVVRGHPRRRSRRISMPAGLAPAVRRQRY